MNMRVDDFMLRESAFLANVKAGQPARVPIAPPPPPRIPDYTEHLAGRAEAAKVSREVPKVHQMNPTIHVQLQVRKIVAQHYADARFLAYNALAYNSETYALLIRLNAATQQQFNELARVAKEVDGTYTVTLP
jgi:hypothetical protein